MNPVAAGAYLTRHWLLSMRTARTIEPITDWYFIYTFMSDIVNVYWIFYKLSS